jgi:hypothetical protein
MAGLQGKNGTQAELSLSVIAIATANPNLNLYADGVPRAWQKQPTNSSRVWLTRAKQLGVAVEHARSR